MRRHHFVSEMFTEHLAFSLFTPVSSIAGKIGSWESQGFSPGPGSFRRPPLLDGVGRYSPGLAALLPLPACAANLEEQSNVDGVLVAHHNHLGPGPPRA